MRVLSNWKIGLLAFLGGAIVLGTAHVATAQGNSRWAHEKNRVRKEQKAIEKARKHGYRLYRGGSYYETDQRGVDLIRRAINTGYQQGYRSGSNNRRYDRRVDHRDDSYYRNGTYGYQSYVDRDQYQHYYREGFERGYRDGYTSEARYGSNSGGKWSILGTVLNGILNLRSF